jgi:NhaP-type Na+/H+ or K+/H+ antiporter
MDVLLAFSAALIGAVFLSALAERSILSMAVLFVVVGFVVEPDVLGWVAQPTEDVTFHVTRLALFAVLFADGLDAHIPRNRAAVLLPARALLVGLPLTIGLNAFVCHWVAGMPWTPSWLAAACLGPTDPVLASAIVGRRSVPARLRSLLNVESGFNDGLAFPAVVALLAVSRGGSAELGILTLELLGGVALGIGVAWVVVLLDRVRFLEATEQHQPLLAFGAAAGVFALASILHANEYLAAFAAGLTLAFRSGDLRASFVRLSSTVAELFKLAALLLFGLLVTPHLFVHMNARGYVAALLILVVVRPVALVPALAGTGLDAREWVTAAWFGPKGFASVIYGLVVFHSGVPGARAVASLIAVVVTMSILAHSSTDVLIARWFERAEGPKAQSPNTRAPV